MSTNNYSVKADIYATHSKDEGTLALAYHEFGALFDKYITSGGNKAVDYGAGTGRSRRYLEEIGFNADGVDIDQSMIDKAKELDKGRENKYFKIEGGVIPKRDSNYDLVFSSLVVLELSSKSAVNDYFLEAKRVMRLDGTLVVLTVNDGFYDRQWLSIDTGYEQNVNAKSGDKVRVRIKEIDLELDDYYWTKDDYREMAKEAGLTIVDEIEPIAHDDSIQWVSEKTYSPYVIFVMKKSEALESKQDLAMKYGLETYIPRRGVFSEISRSKEILKKDILGSEFTGDRNASATIKLLMKPGDFWPFHRLKSSETLKHIEGNDLIIHCISHQGTYYRVTLGCEGDNSLKEFCVPPMHWFAEEVQGENGFVLIEATTKPGFHIDDTEEASGDYLLSLVGDCSIELMSIINRFNPIEKKIMDTAAWSTSKEVMFKNADAQTEVKESEKNKLTL